MQKGGGGGGYSGQKGGGRGCASRTGDYPNLGDAAAASGPKAAGGTAISDQKLAEYMSAQRLALEGHDEYVPAGPTPAELARSVARSAVSSAPSFATTSFASSGKQKKGKQEHEEPKEEPKKPPPTRMGMPAPPKPEPEGPLRPKLKRIKDLICAGCAPSCCPDCEVPEALEAVHSLVQEIWETAEGEDEEPGEEEVEPLRDLLESMLPSVTPKLLRPLPQTILERMRPGAPTADDGGEGMEEEEENEAEKAEENEPQEEDTGRTVEDATMTKIAAVLGGVGGVAASSSDAAPAASKEEDFGGPSFKNRCIVCGSVRQAPMDFAAEGLEFFCAVVGHQCEVQPLKNRAGKQALTTGGAAGLDDEEPVAAKGGLGSKEKNQIFKQFAFYSEPEGGGGKKKGSQERVQPNTGVVQSQRWRYMDGQRIHAEPRTKKERKAAAAAGEDG